MSSVPVVAVRNYPHSVSFEVILGLERRSQWCIDANGGRAVLHALDPDGRRSICVYRAPDAEAMRRVADMAGSTLPTTVWAATEHWNGTRPDLASSGPGERTIGLVERRLQRPTPFEELQAAENAKSHCLDIHGVRFLRSYLSLDRMTMLCLYAAPDLEAIRRANDMTRLPFAGVLETLVRDPG